MGAKGEGDRLLGRVTWKGGTALLLLLMAVGLAACGGPVLEAGWGAFAADAPRVYAGIDGKFVAIKPEAAATPAWTFVPKDEKGNAGGLGGFYAMPALTPDLVIFAATARLGNNAPTEQVYALDRETGEQRWSFAAKATVVGEPRVYGDTLYVTSADHNLYARDLKSGETKVLFTAAGPLWGSVVREGDRLYFGSMAHKVYAIDSTGRMLWAEPFRTQGAVAGTPALGDGRVYVGDLTGRVYALDAQTGKPVWSEPFRAHNWIWGQPVLVGDTVYVPSLDGNVYALDAKTGAEKPDWHIRTKGAVRAAPTLAGNVLYVASEDQHLYAVDVNIHQPKWSPFKTDGALLTSPVVVGDTVYVTTSKGKVYLVDAASGNGRLLYPQPK